MLAYMMIHNCHLTYQQLREIMESGVEPLALMSQLASVITDILAGSYDMTKEGPRRKFFRRQACKSKIIYQPNSLILIKKTTHKWCLCILASVYVMNLIEKAHFYGYSVLVDFTQVNNHKNYWKTPKQGKKTLARSPRRRHIKKINRHEIPHTRTLLLESSHRILANFYQC